MSLSTTFKSALPAPSAMEGNQPQGAGRYESIPNDQPYTGHCVSSVQFADQDSLNKSPASLKTTMNNVTAINFKK